jgi:hypothetical protein
MSGTVAERLAAEPELLNRLNHCRAGGIVPVPKGLTLKDVSELFERERQKKLWVRVFEIVAANPDMTKVMNMKKLRPMIDEAIVEGERVKKFLYG